jgi:predicted unusual protein kinase regulating ubiquinone biosynthesis (AarF/ABC1/UbiB family)
MNSKTVYADQSSTQGNLPTESVTNATVSVEAAQVSIPELKLAETPIEERQSQGLRYDPEVIAAHYQQRTIEVWVRSLSVLWTFITFALTLWWDKQSDQVIAKASLRAARLREILTDLGPAFIKVGQALSTRPDLIPSVYLEELTKLQDQLPPFPNEVAYQFIEEELGDQPENIYAEISKEPIAAASLGQVYKGKLKTGEIVAIKVQRPDLAENIGLDIYILRNLAAWTKRRFKRIRSDLVAIMDEFGERIYEEMDYTLEAGNAQRFAKLYGHIKDIYVPKVYPLYTNRRVLTMEWVTGTKLTNLEAIKEQGIDASYLINVGVQCSLRQLLEHGFFHADPHPGNLLATAEGKLVYLDFGMMSEIKPYQRYGLLEAVVHLVNRDFEGLAYDYIKLDFLKPDTDLTPIIPALANVFNNALGASVAELNFKSITDQLSEIMYEYPFQVPAYYALIIRSMVTLEGIAINVDPNFKVLSKAYPYVAKRLLSDPAPELRASLRDLLFKDDSFRWNRLENLLKNAGGSDDYDISRVLHQALEFIFSERGDLIRERIVNELIKGLDSVSRNAIDNAKAVVSEWFGIKSNNSPLVIGSPIADAETWEHIKKVWRILRETPGFEPMQLVQILPPLLIKPQVQEMGQQVMLGLLQRSIARLIREFLLAEETIKPPTQNPNQLSLPPGVK